RLANQYAMKKSVYGWTTPVPSTIELSEIRTVLDIAAGTCVWTIDLATTPQIKARRDEVSIYACDINPAFFPPATVTEELGIKTFQQDVTKPFPTEFHGTFDLVHMCFLVLCLTEDGWTSALANIYTLLKPGGRVMIDELDPGLFKEGQYLRPADGGSYDLKKCMTGKSWINKLNCLYTGFVLKNNFIVGLSFRMGGMLEKAGFTVEGRQVGTGAVGKLCRVVKGLDGGSMAAYEESSVDNMEFVVKQFADIMLKNGTLEVPPGNRVADEEELNVVLGEVREGLRTEGAIAVGACFVGRKF
ncbi:S-adenosyl-L-methionine-dependent methyltransferase, partial [Mycena rosella]